MIKGKEFGTQFTDHLFVMEWQENKGWHNERIQPYQNFSLSPSSSNLHYGQEIFEGIKAFKMANNRIALFRPRNHFNRMNNSAKIMCMPAFDVEHVLTWLKKLVALDAAWIPQNHEQSLYIRPTMIAVEHSLDIKPAKHFLFFIILSPVDLLYAQEFNTLPILVCEKYTRASSGGVGEAKAAGNYAASMRAQKEAYQVGCTQVLWLDPLKRINIEEVGTMNIFFVINTILVTPKLTDSILAGITRLSIIELGNNLGISVQERTISIDEIITGIQDGSVQEAFGSGTAAGIAPIGSLRYKDHVYTINNNHVGSWSQKIHATLQSIHYGTAQDIHSWLEFVA